MDYYPVSIGFHPESSIQYTGNIKTIEAAKQELDDLYNPNHIDYDFMCEAERSERECALKSWIKNHSI